MKLLSIGETEVRIGPLLFALIPAAAVLGGLKTTAAAFLSLCVHEAAHAMTAVRLGYPVRSVEIQPFGFVARLDTRIRNTGDAAAIFAAGPAASLCVSAFSALLESFFPFYREAKLGLTEYNLLVAAVNLLPALPLDGGRLLGAAFANRNGRAAFAVLRASGVITGLIFIAVWVLLLLRGAFNPTFFVMGVFLLVAAVGEKADRVPSVLKRGVRVGKSVPVTQTAVSEDTKLSTALSILPKGGYCVLLVVGGDGGILMRLDEKQIREAAARLRADASLSEAVALFGEAGYN